MGVFSSLKIHPLWYIVAYFLVYHNGCTLKIHPLKYTKKYTSTGVFSGYRRWKYTRWCTFWLYRKSSLLVFNLFLWQITIWWKSFLSTLIIIFLTYNFLVCLLLASVSWRSSLFSAQLIDHRDRRSATNLFCLHFSVFTLLPPAALNFFLNFDND